MPPLPIISEPILIEFVSNNFRYELVVRNWEARYAASSVFRKLCCIMGLFDWFPALEHSVPRITGIYNTGSI